MTVTYFRERPEGPEAAIEDAVAYHAVDVLSEYEDVEYWLGSSLPIGAGQPDLMLVGFHQEVLDLADFEITASHLLGYLRSVRMARPETIALRLNLPVIQVESILDDLTRIDAVWEGSAYSLADPWDDILPNVISIEAKVADWRKAVSQAARNRLFSHRSYVALPENVAERIRNKPILRHLGIGVLAVHTSGDVWLAHRARSHRPKIWYYYYQIALMLAKNY